MSIGLRHIEPGDRVDIAGRLQPLTFISIMTALFDLFRDLLYEMRIPGDDAIASNLPALRRAMSDCKREAGLIWRAALASPSIGI